MWVRVLDEMTAGDIKDGDWVTFTESPDAKEQRAMEVEQGKAYVGLRWAYQGERCWIPRSRIVFRISWTEEQCLCQLSVTIGGISSACHFLVSAKCATPGRW